MDSRRGARLSSDAGFSTLQFVVAAALSLLLTVGLLDVAVTQYGIAVVRSGLEEGVRAGARVGATPGTCEAAARSWLDDALGGSRGDHVSIRCGRSVAVVSATASVRWPSFLPGLPGWSFELDATRARATT